MEKIVFGIVQRFKPTHGELSGYATVIVPELGRQLTASLDCGPFFIGAGESMPFWDIDRKLNIPRDGTEVVMEVSEYTRSLRVVSWGYALYWRKAETEIARRPVYRVVRENRFKGQIMKSEARSEGVFTGNLKALVATHPRDGLRVSTKDQLAPTYKTGPVTAINRFEIRENGGDWKPCQDPRPFPVGAIYRLTYWESGHPEQLAMGTALEINFKFPCGDNDPLAKYENSGGHLAWELNSSYVPGAELKWVEVADPRPLPLDTATVKAFRPRKSVDEAMPAKAREFETTVKSLGDLVMA